MMGTMVRRRRTSTNQQRSVMRKVWLLEWRWMRVSVVALAVLWRTASMIPRFAVLSLPIFWAVMEWILRPVRFLKWRLWDVAKFLIEVFLVTMKLAYDLVSSMTSVVGNYLHYTFQAIAILDVILIATGGMFGDGLLLLVDEIFELFKLSPHPIKFGNVLFDAVFREVHRLA